MAGNGWSTARAGTGAVAALLALVIALVVPIGASGDEHGADTTRLAGTGRYETAVAIAGAAFPDGADRVYVARADAFPDALAGGALTDGPILLVPPDGTVPQVVIDAVGSLGPDDVIALGGPGAITTAVLDQVADGRPTDRLMGPGRYETAVAISQEAFPATATTAYVARGDTFPDALAGGALTDGPILLVPPEGAVAQVVKSEIARLGPENVVALGGTGAVSEDVLTDAAGGRPTGRLSGTTRYETAVEISQVAFPDTAATVYIARGDTFPDALAGGALTDGPILLVPPTGAVPEVILDEIARLGPATVVALGGPGAVPQGILLEAGAAVTAVSVQPGTVMFTVSDGVGSRVLAVAPDGSSLRTAYECETASCKQLDWEAGGRHLLLYEEDLGIQRVDGQPLEATRIRGRSTRVVPWEFDAHDIVSDDPAFANFWRIDGGQGYGIGRINNSGHTTTSGGPFRHPASFQSISTSPARGDCVPVMLHLLEDDSLEIIGCPPGNTAGWERIAAHAQRRAGAAVLGAALVPDGTGDIVITDEIGGEGQLRMVPLSGGEVVVDGLDVTSTPYVMPAHDTVVVLADLGSTTGLVAVDRATGATEVLVQDAAAGGSDHRIMADGSGTFVAWTTGTDIRIVDTRDGSVTVVAPPGGAAITGGPVIRP